jgi:hypothetical protein
MSSLKRVDFTEIYKAITGLPLDDFELKDKLLTAVDNCAYDNGYSDVGDIEVKDV